MDKQINGLPTRQTDSQTVIITFVSLTNVGHKKNSLQNLSLLFQQYLEKTLKSFFENPSAIQNKKIKICFAARNFYETLSFL